MNKTLLAVYLQQISFIIQYVNFVENTVTAASFLKIYIVTLYSEQLGHSKHYSLEPIRFPTMLGSSILS